MTLINIFGSAILICLTTLALIMCDNVALDKTRSQANRVANIIALALLAFAAVYSIYVINFDTSLDAIP